MNTNLMALDPHYECANATVNVPHIPVSPDDLPHLLEQYRELRAIGCEFKLGKLILHGKVSSYYLKQICQEALRSLSNDLHATIENRIEVSCP